MGLKRPTAVALVFLLLGFGAGYSFGRSGTSLVPPSSPGASVEHAKPTGFSLPGVTAVADSPLSGQLLSKAQPMIKDLFASIKSVSAVSYKLSLPETTDPGDWMLLEYPPGTFMQVQGGSPAAADLVLIQVEPDGRIWLYASNSSGREWRRFEVGLEASVFRDYIQDARVFLKSFGSGG